MMKISWSQNLHSTATFLLQKYLLQERKQEKKYPLLDPIIEISLYLVHLQLEPAYVVYGGFVKDITQHLVGMLQGRLHEAIQGGVEGIVPSSYICFWWALYHEAV